MSTTASQHRLGLIFVGLAALCWSQSGVFARIISADLMTLLFLRGLFSGTAVFLFYCISERRFAIADFKAVGWPGILVACFSAMSMISGIGALRFGNVADAMVIYATVPFTTAALAYLVFGERTRISTIVASLVALLGVMVMMLGADWGGGMLGKGLAVLMMLGMAGCSLVMRRHRELPMMLALALSAWLVSAVTFAFADPFSVSSQDFMLIGLFGVFQNAAGLALYTLGTRRIPAAEATLVAALEVPFTPLWVWLLLNETPPTYTLIGGAIVMLALFTHIFGEFRRSGSTTVAEFAPMP